MPSLMCLVRSAATPMNTSGDAMISNPAEWCSPIHASCEPEAVHRHDQVEVPLDGERRVLPDRDGTGP